MLYRLEFQINNNNNNNNNNNKINKNVSIKMVSFETISTPRLEVVYM